jgi:hypothetical protein
MNRLKPFNCRRGSLGKLVILAAAVSLVAVPATALAEARKPVGNTSPKRPRRKPCPPKKPRPWKSRRRKACRLTTARKTPVGNTCRKKCRRAAPVLRTAAASRCQKVCRPDTMAAKTRASRIAKRARPGRSVATNARSSSRTSATTSRSSASASPRSQRRFAAVPPREGRVRARASVAGAGRASAAATSGPA